MSFFRRVPFERNVRTCFKQSPNHRYCFTSMTDPYSLNRDHDMCLYHHLTVCETAPQKTLFPFKYKHLLARQ